MSIIYNSLNDLKTPFKNPVLTIGNFDGVHKGHLALFDKVKKIARDIDGQSVVMTFDPHPVKVMKPGFHPPLITPTEQKLELIQLAGIDVILCIPFTKEFASIPAEDFIKDILLGKIGIKEIVVGYDYSFGYKRQGTIDLLKTMGERYGFKVHVINQISMDGCTVSSTAIRKLVQEGDLDGAKKLLDRDYQVCGVVVKGKNRGARLLGYPTANLKLVDELIPKFGVYAVQVIVDGKQYNGLTNIGYNPTFGSNAFSIETHILDFSGNLLGETITVKFIKRLRDEKTFNSIEVLSEQIGKDIIEAKKVFKQAEEKKEGCCKS